MDLAALEAQLEAGEKLKIKYRYPLEPGPGERGSVYGIRSDKLEDVSVELRRFYTRFRGEQPIWIKEDEVIAITPDDGVYEDY